MLPDGDAHAARRAALTLLPSSIPSCPSSFRARTFSRPSRLPRPSRPSSPPSSPARPSLPAPPSSLACPSPSISSAFSLLPSRPSSYLPPRAIGVLQARPSQTGPQVKHSSASDHDGSAVPAAVQGSTRGRSPKPVIKSILKPSAGTRIASRPVSACSGPIDFSGRAGLCKASAEVYAAAWRPHPLPAQEWDNRQLPIERLDRFAPRLLADEDRPRKVQFVQARRCRIQSRWIGVQQRWVGIGIRK